jgi:hypothetical protein
MSSQFLATIACAFPIVVAMIAFIVFSKGNHEKRGRKTIYWLISALSIPWLLSVWQSKVETPDDLRVFGWSLIITLPIWLTWRVLVNMRGKYKKLIRLLLFIGILPICLYVIIYSLNVMPPLPGTREVELFGSTSMFGLFLILGLWVRDYEVAPFRDK